MREIDRLIADIKRLQYDDVEKMYECCLKLKEYATQQNDDYMLCFANNYIIDYYYSCKTQQQTLKLANEVLAMNEEKGYPDLLMQVYNLYAIAVCHNDYSLATGYYLKSLKIAKELDDHIMIAKLNCNLGDVFLNLNRCDLAESYFIEALKHVNMISPHLPEYKSIRFILCYLVMTYCDKGKLDEAYQVMNENESLFQGAKADPLNQLWRALKALIHYENGEIEESLIYIDDILNCEIYGFRVNEIMYLMHNVLLNITFQIKDKERTKCLYHLLEKNDFGKTGIRYQIKMLDMRIKYCLIFNDDKDLPELYAKYYQLMHQNEKENTDFCLNSVLYKIELFKEQEEKKDIVKLSQLDELTKIYNRRFFHHKYSEVKNKSELIGIILFDLDHFKQHNDSLGHLNGDLILKDFASCLQQNDENIVSCRFGGDEFICICVDCDEKMIIHFIEQVYACFEAYNHEGITISCGYYNTYSHCLSKEELINNADFYLYFVKDNGKNGYYGYSVK